MTIYQFLLPFLLWICLPHFCSPEIMFRRTPAPQQRILGPRVPRSDGKILHRQKRGWMWNQFFLLEEYTGSDYQYVGKVSLCWNGKYLHSFLVCFIKDNLEEIRTITLINLIPSIFLQYFIYLFLEGEGREKNGRETSMCCCLLSPLHRWPGLQPRHVP